VTFSEIAGLAVVLGYYAAKKKEFGDIRIRSEKNRRREILRDLFRIAFPITLGACTMSVVGAIDSAIVMRVLTGNGYSTAEATGLFGLLTGFVQPIVNMPAVLSGALAMSIVPTVSAAFAVKNREKISRQANFAYKLSCVIGMPCAAGVFLLAKELLAAIYPNLTAAELEQASAMMRIMAPGIYLMSISQVSSGVLQGIGKTVYPVLAMLLGTMVKLFLGIWLIRVPSVNILGAAWGTLLYFAVNAAVDILFAMRFADLRIGVKTVILPTAVCTAGMGAAVWAMREFTASGIWITVLAGAVGYGILLIVTKTVTAEELGFAACRDRKILKRSRREV
ncbi:MAG: polysaccharide biosynthesis C-terminal domain-containing protein, partial [Christensenellaceae bacterium]|nr:polysaccharide biosynthesis C-terminal domain-containing protein [Christensenellaceae bacterium]